MPLELGFMACFKSRAAAERHAARLPKEEMRTKLPTLVKIKVEEVGVVDLSLFSVRPATGECLLPLCTYLEMRSEANVSAIVDGTEKGKRHEVKFTVVEAVPHTNEAWWWSRKVTANDK